MAMILKDVESETVRWLCVIVFMLALCITTCIVARGLFRCWERVFSSMTSLKAFWVIVLLSNPAPLPHSGMGVFRLFLLITFALLIGVTAWLLLTRNRSVEPLRVQLFSRWTMGVWAGTVAAVLGLAWLQNGIRLGVFRETIAQEIHPAREAVAGFLNEYGLRDAVGSDLPERTQLFVVGNNQTLIIPSYAGEVLDVIWLPGIDRLLAVYHMGVLQINTSSKDMEWAWKPEDGYISKAYHGSQGMILAILRSPPLSWPEKYSIYAFDGIHGVTCIYPADHRPSTPHFTAIPSPSAWLTVGDDLWEIEWPGDKENDFRVHRHAGLSKGLSFAGFSGEHRWFRDKTHLRSGDTSVSFTDVDSWIVGSQGLYTIEDGKRWRLTTPEGAIKEEGNIDNDEILLLSVDQGVPWVVMRTGEVRPLTTLTRDSSFRVSLPR
ncbi:MAG: hypothetical protein HY716_08025 [Planctomycetes bacterium]|nr:hypothetical protein [Planctomycetota bacterium]